MGRHFFSQSVQKDCVVLTASYSVTAVGSYPEGQTPGREAVHLPRRRKSGAVTPLLRKSSWCAKQQLYLHFKNKLEFVNGLRERH